MPHDKTARRGAGAMPVRALCTALAAAALPTMAAAEANPYYLGASQTLGYDSNIFRRPADRPLGIESSGLISTTSLVAGIDQPIGRQRVRADATVSHNSYADQSQLDHNSWSLGAGLDWDTVYRLSGTLSVDLSRGLGDYGDSNSPSGTGRKIDDNSRIELLVRLGDASRSRMWLESNLVHSRVDTDAEIGEPGLTIGDVPGVVRYDREQRIDALSLGVRYRVSGALLLGASLRGQKSDDDYILVQQLGSLPPSTLRRPEASHRNDLDLTAAWDPRGASRINARVSYSRKKFDDDNIGRERADFSGITGSGEWVWQPTGKIQTVTSLAYDTEDRTNLGQNTTGSRTWRLGGNVSWAATAKISARAGLTLDRQKLDSAGGGNRSDLQTGLTLGATWAPTRSISLSCQLGRFDRNESQLSDGYRAHTASCSGQVVLQ